MYSPAFSWPHSSLITNQKQPGGPSPPLAGLLLFPLPFSPFRSPRPFLESSRLSSKGLQAVTCLPDPLFPLLPHLLSFIRFLALPRENSSLRYFCAILPSFNSRFLAPSHPSFPFPLLPPFLPILPFSSLHHCERETRYVFIVDIYISLLHAKTREL